MNHAWALGAFLSGVLLAGCSGPVGPASETNGHDPFTAGRAVTLVTDAEGDARVYGMGVVNAFVQPQKCGITPAAARSPCQDAMTGAADLLPSGTDTGLPEPALDVMAVTATDTPSTLILNLTVSSLDATLEGAVAEDGEQTAGWYVCWRDHSSTTDQGGWARIECAYLFAMETNGVQVVEATFERNTLDCNFWGWCSWTIPFEMKMGAPATISFAVPRSIMGSPESEDVLEDVWMGSHRTHRPVGEKLADVGYRLALTGALYENPRVFNSHRYTADESLTGGDYTLQSERPSTHARPDSAMLDLAGDVARSDTDLLSMRFLEDAWNMTVAIEVARVDETPEDHTMSVALGMPSGRVHEMGYAMQEGQMEAWAGACVDPECSDWVAHDVLVSRVVGSPGWVNLTVGRQDLGFPAAGEQITLALAEMRHMTLEAASPPAGGVASVFLGVGAMSDHLQASAWRFVQDTAAAEQTAPADTTPPRR